MYTQMTFNYDTAIFNFVVKAFSLWFAMTIDM